MSFTGTLDASAEIAHDALHPVFCAEHVQGQQWQQRRDRQSEVAEFRSSDEKHNETERKDHESRAEIWLDKDKSRDQCDPNQHREKPILEILHPTVLCCNERSKVKDKSIFCKLRRLQSQSAQSQPARRPFYLAAKNECNQQDGHHGNDDDFCCPLKLVIVNAHQY